MLTYRFDDENDLSATVNALRVAAEHFEGNAKTLRKDVRPPLERMAEQFDHQAAQARRIAEEMEQVCG